MHPGVYRTHTGPTDWLGPASAVLVHLGRGAALSLGSAAHLLGIEDRQPAVFTAVVPHDRQPVRVPGAPVSRRRREIVSTTRRGPAVTVAATTVIDLGDIPSASREDVISVAARGVQRGKVTVEAVFGVVVELDGVLTHEPGLAPTRHTMEVRAPGSVQFRTGGDSPRPGRSQRPVDWVELPDRR